MKIKNLVLSTVSAFVFAGVIAKAEITITSPNSPVDIPECGGKAQWFVKEGSNGKKGVVRLKGVKDCSNYSTSLETGKLDLQADKTRSADFEFPLSPGNTVVLRIYLASNSGKHDQEIVIKAKSNVAAAPTKPAYAILKSSGAYASLKLCGGRDGGFIQLTSKENGQSGQTQYIVNIKGNDRCDKFDILESQGARILYTAKDVPSKDSSFTLPNRVIDRGVSFGDPILDLLLGVSEVNLIKIKLYNSYNPNINDTFYLQFVDSGYADSTQDLEIEL